MILSFSLNYQRISILANFLSEPKIDNLIHFDHEFLLQLLKNNIVFKNRYPFYTNVIDDTFNGIDYVEILETYIEKDLYEELKKKNELDDNLIKGINRDSLKIKEKTKIEEIIEEDDIDNFRLLSNDYNFNFNQIIQRESGLYDYSKTTITLYCIEKNAIKCFKFALINGADPSQYCILVTTDEWGGLKIINGWDGYGFAGAIGNIQMIKLLEQNIPINKNLMEGCSKFHQNNLIHWIEKEHKALLKDGLRECIRYNNFEGFEIISQNIDIINFMNQNSNNSAFYYYYPEMKNSKEIGELLILLILSKGADINLVAIIYLNRKKLFLLKQFKINKGH